MSAPQPEPEPASARRSKKRPSLGVRTVELSRGQSGYGLTLSGQAPCVLSCVLRSSPAFRAGLKIGDSVVAVNGTNVSKASHDQVVQVSTFKLIIIVIF